MSKFYKIMFSISMITGSLLAVSSYSWIFMWFGLEINLLSIIPLLKDEKNFFASESAFKYFLVQVLASSIILFFFIMIDLAMMIEYLYFMLIPLYSALLMKIGMAPFHFWFPEVIEGLSWLNCLIMMTLQKMAPMIILFMILVNSNLILVSVILSSIIGGFLGLNQVSIRKIMAYSSINHSAWMIISMMVYSKLWLVYFSIYSIMNVNLIIMFNKLNCFYVNQLKMLDFNFMFKICLIMNFFSFSGLPPLIGFFPKWLTIFYMVNNYHYMIIVMLILTTLVSIYMYIRLLFSFLLLFKNKMIFQLKLNISQSFMLFNFIFLLSLPLYSMFYI